MTAVSVLEWRFGRDLERLWKTGLEEAGGPEIENDGQTNSYISTAFLRRISGHSGRNFRGRALVPPISTAPRGDHDKKADALVELVASIITSYPPGTGNHISTIHPYHVRSNGTIVLYAQ